MTLRVTVQQAAENALTLWLRSQLAGVTLKNEWPEAGKAMAFPTVTVLRAGPLDEDYVQPPEVLLQVDDPPPAVTSTFTFRVGVCTQPLQLDVWANTKPQRDDLLARLGDALTAGKRQTYSAGYFTSTGISTNQDPVEQSITLQLADGYPFLNAAFQFEAPETNDTADSAKRNEWRATYRGQAFFDRVTSRNLPRLVSVSLPISVTPSGADVPVGSRPTLVVTPSSTTRTKT
ncbi:MAG TPA: hypothetical protein VGI39_39735 [Polyangiaceae bacterium]|jgi:hypothetical protein